MTSPQASYKGMTLQIPSLDQDNLTYFRFCADGRFHLQRCLDCQLLRYPPTTCCPWCASDRSRWDPVEASGSVHSYTVVRHAIQPGFKENLPYTVLLVDLDTQNGKPSPGDALRVVGNLVDADGTLAPAAWIDKVHIGMRVRMTFTRISSEIALPQWTLS